jgi:polysaccharide biosynthesis transport protein
MPVEHREGKMRSNSSAAPPEEYAERHEGDLDLRVLGAAVWRKRRWIILPTLIAFALSLAYVQTAAPLYKSTAMLLLERGESTFTRPDGTERDQNAIDQETVASQVQLIESRDLARRVVNDLKLADNPDFMPGEGFSLGRLLKAIGIGGAGQQRAREEQAIDIYADNLLVYPMDKTRVIGVEFSSRSPELAARVVNAVTDAYLELQRGAKQEQNRQATQWLAVEIESMRKRVEEAEAQVAARRTGANLLLGANNTTLVTQQLGETNALLARARTAQADAEAKARVLREMIRSGRGFDSIEIGNSELIRRLTEQRVTLQATMASEGRTLLGGHPRMKELNAQIAGLDAQIKVEAERQTRIYENEARAAAARVESLTRELDEQKRLATTANEDDVQLRALEREAKAQRDLLEQFLGRYREASARESMDAMPADARVISRGAVPSQPDFPK